MLLIKKPQTIISFFSFYTKLCYRKRGFFVYLFIPHVKQKECITYLWCVLYIPNNVVFYECNMDSEETKIYIL